MPASRTYVLGLTGGIGCGKSEAANRLRALGAAHVDADAISRALTQTGGAALPDIRAAFGPNVFQAEGVLDRRALADIVFNDAAKKRALEGIIHPLVQRRVLDEIDEASAKGIAVTVLDVPLLFETGMDVLCDETWTMSAREETQIARVRERDGLSEEQVRARMAGQLSCAERNARATRVFDSDCPLEKTIDELTRAYNAILKRLSREG